MAECHEAGVAWRSLGPAIGMPHYVLYRQYAGRRPGRRGRASVHPSTALSSTCSGCARSWGSAGRASASGPPKLPGPPTRRHPRTGLPRRAGPQRQHVRTQEDAQGAGAEAEQKPATTIAGIDRL